MKLFIILFFVSNSIFAQTKKEEEFILKGKVNYPTDRYIYFVWRNKDDGFRFVDSTMVINGQFSFKGTIYGYSDRFYIKSDPNNFDNNDSINNVQVPIDNSIMNINLKVGSFSKYKLVGCKTIKALELERNTIAHSKSKKSKLEWCKKHISNSAISITLCKWEENFTFKELKDFYLKTSKNQKKSLYGIRLEKIINRKENEENQVGKQALLFEKIGFDNALVSLKAINKTGYVLLDFWGSWCGPCRASHPHLIKLFKKYNSNGLNIIGIAADNGNEEKWKAAIKEDSINIWSHVLEGEKIKNDSLSYNLSNEYLIHYYPTKILIDTKGEIVGRYGSEDFEVLEKKLKEIYKF